MPLTPAAGSIGCTLCPYKNFKLKWVLSNSSQALQFCLSKNTTSKVQQATHLEERSTSGLGEKGLLDWSQHTARRGGDLQRSHGEIKSNVATSQAKTLLTRLPSELQRELDISLARQERTSASPRTDEDF